MKLSNRLRPLLRVLFGTLLFSPFLIWLIHIEQWSMPDGSVLAELILRTIWQSGLSALLSLVFGTLLYFCVEGYRGSRWFPTLELALLLPNLLPPLFIIVAVMSLGIGTNLFPMGLGAVVLTHALINGGLVAVALARIFPHKMGGMLELARLEGASRLKTFFKVALPYMKTDFASLFVFVFSLCMTSLSIPMILGGLHASTFEIAIYQTIKMEGAWSQAVVLAGIQSLTLFAVAWFLPRPFTPARPARMHATFFSWPRLKYFVFLPSVAMVAGWVSSLFQRPYEIQIQMEDVLVPALLHTLMISLSVGLLHLAFMLLVTYLLPHRGLEKFLNGYLAPSAVIIGFAFLLLPGDSNAVMTLKLIVALTLWSFPILFRWLGYPMLTSMQDQIHVARTLGAGPWLILWRVIFPQCAPVYFMASGLAALWASGDFALTSILAGGQWTWALLIQDMVSMYRLNLASLMLVPMFLLGLSCYAFFRGLGRYVAS